MNLTRRRLGTFLAVGALAACSAAANVTVEDASEITGAGPPAGSPPSDLDESTDEPAATAPEKTTPETATPDATTPDTTTASSEPGTSTSTSVELRPPDLGVDDALFPALGSSDIDVVSYEVLLDASDPTQEVTGSVTIEAKVASDVEAVAFDSAGPLIEAASVDGDDVPFELVDGELLLDTTREQVADGEVSVSIQFTFDPDAAAESSVGLPIGWIPAGEGAFVLNEPDGASRWLPSNDHPSDKATWRFEITTSEGHIASANGVLLDRPADGDAGTWVWEESDPMPTYLVHLVVGRYELVEGDPVTSMTGDAIPLTHLVPAGDRERFEDDIEPTADQIAFFEELFGPYPLERYGLAFVRGLSGLAMETQGRSLFGATDFEAADVGYVQHLLLSHELAHQWFGNAVSPATWDALWLNESLTTYAQWLWLDEVGLQPIDAWADDQLERRLAGSIDATGDPELENLFGFERYEGGAVVVHALRRTLGDDDVFFDLLRRWIADNNGTSQSTADFIALAEEVHGADLAPFFEDWLFAIELPPRYPE